MNIRAFIETVTRKARTFSDCYYFPSYDSGNNSLATCYDNPGIRNDRAKIIFGSFYGLMPSPSGGIFLGQTAYELFTIWLVVLLGLGLNDDFIDFLLHVLGLLINIEIGLNEMPWLWKTLIATEDRG